MEQMTATAIIAIGPSSKEEAVSFAAALTEEVKSGYTNPLVMWTRINAFLKALEAVKQNISDDAISEAMKFGTGSFEAYGCSMKVKESGVKYDYSVCNDSAWEQLDSQIKNLTDRRKEREAFLKAIPGSMTVVNEETGEVATVRSPIKKSSTIVEVTLK